MLNKVIVKFCPIGEVKGRAQIVDVFGANPQLLAHATLSRLKNGFPLARVTTACISPQQGAVVFSCSALLKQRFSAFIE